MITPSFSLTATERVLPKLALDFTTASLDSRITFTRTTGASNPATYVNSTGVVTAATNNQPRFDYDPVTLACKGLLIEESRENKCLQSQNLSVTWTNQGSSESVDVAVSPDGTQNADKLIEDSALSAHAIRQDIVTTAATWTFSIYAKAAERSYLILYNTTAGFAKTFDIATGQVGTGTVGTVTATISNAGNGWYRCSISGTCTAASNAFRVYLNTTDSTSSSYQGNGTSGAYLWGAQVELGAFATSYIPTTTTALTRNADVATMTGTNFSDWFNASEGGAVIQVLPRTISGTRPAVEFDDNTANETIVLRGVAADPQLYVVDGGAAQATLDAGTITANEAYRLAGAWKSSSFATAINGAASVSQLSGTYPTVTQARFGSDGTNYLNGWLQNFRYWPQRITNAETQAFSK